MEIQAGVEFYEGDLVVKTLSTSDELAKAYRLRHKVFAETLRWVSPSEDGQEMDIYDLWGTSIGLVRHDGQLLGLARLLPASGEFMLERDLRVLLPQGHVLRKERDTAEITRLALDPAIRDKGLSARLMLSLIKGIYQWALVHDVRYFYLEVEHRFFRVLLALGIPCDPLGPPVALPPAGALSVAATMDIVKCEKVLAQKRPQLMEWMAAMVMPDGHVVKGSTSQCREVELGFPAQAGQLPVLLPAA
ncbi:MAG TPA: GNAT family N-acetyltransferase [Nitrospiraceae bacterium]|jgi:acyl homoserine lactone synthase|nr:GNAT family N-acetyltransferase [Nitrospiraceae bacterium]